MKKAYRIKSEKDYQRTYHQGQSKANRQLVVYTRTKPGQEHFRVGLSVGKRLGNAVMRNRLKRQLRHIVRDLAPAIDPELDFLLIARAGIRTMSFQELQGSVIHVMNLAGVLDLSRVKI